MSVFEKVKLSEFNTNKRTVESAYMDMFSEEKNYVNSIEMLINKNTKLKKKKKAKTNRIMK